MRHPDIGFMTSKTEINSKEWYEFFKALFLLYPELTLPLSSELIKINSPQLRYIIAAVGEVNEESLLTLANKSFSKEEDLAMLAKISKEARLSNPVVEKIVHMKMGKKMLPHISENLTLSYQDAYLILHMSGNSIIKNFVARNISSPQLIEAALAHKDFNVLEGLLYNSNLSSETIIAILEKLKFAPPAILAASRNPNSPYDFLLSWSKNPESSVQRTLATNPAIPYEIQDILSSNADERTLITLAKNPALDPDIQQRFLATLYTDTVRFGLAENPNLASAVAIQIFNSELPSLRAFAISQNQHISPSILAQLAADEDNKDVIKAIGNHPNVSSHTWEMMVNRSIKLGYRIDPFFLSFKERPILDKYSNHLPNEKRYLLSLQESVQIRKSSTSVSNSMDHFARSIRLYCNSKIDIEELMQRAENIFAI